MSMHLIQLHFEIVSCNSDKRNWLQSISHFCAKSILLIWTLADIASSEFNCNFAQKCNEWFCCISLSILGVEIVGIENEMNENRRKKSRTKKPGSEQCAKHFQLANYSRFLALKKRKVSGEFLSLLCAPWWQPLATRYILLISISTHVHADAMPWPFPPWNVQDKNGICVSQLCAHRTGHHTPIQRYKYSLPSPRWISVFARRNAALFSLVSSKKSLFFPSTRFVFSLSYVCLLFVSLYYDCGLIILFSLCVREASCNLQSVIRLVERKFAKYAKPHWISDANCARSAPEPTCDRLKPNCTARRRPRTDRPNGVRCTRTERALPIQNSLASVACIDAVLQTESRVSHSTQQHHVNFSQFWLYFRLEAIVLSHCFRFVRRHCFSRTEMVNSKWVFVWRQSTLNCRRNIRALVSLEITIFTCPIHFTSWLRHLLVIRLFAQKFDEFSQSLTLNLDTPHKKWGFSLRFTSNNRPCSNHTDWKNITTSLVGRSVHTRTTHTHSKNGGRKAPVRETLLEMIELSTHSNENDIRDAERVFISLCWWW